MPNIPNIKPDIKVSREEAVNLVIASIAMEEIALAHILNAEAEKLQKAIGIAKSIDELLRVNEDVNNVINSIIKKEMLLQTKLESVFKFIDDEKEKNKKPPCPKPPCCCCKTGSG